MNATPLFPLGRIVATSHALQVLTGDDILHALIRHHVGDWGSVHPEDEGKNDEALKTGARLFSVYTSEVGATFWIITEADRSSTTVLLPEDY